MSPVLFYNRINGELVYRLRGSNQTSTHIPDMDNANVRTFLNNTGNFQIGVSRILILGVQRWLK